MLKHIVFPPLQIVCFAASKQPCATFCWNTWSLGRQTGFRVCLHCRIAKLEWRRHTVLLAQHLLGLLGWYHAGPPLLRPASFAGPKGHGTRPTPWHMTHQLQLDLSISRWLAQEKEKKRKADDCSWAARAPAKWRLEYVTLQPHTNANDKPIDRASGLTLWARISQLHYNEKAISSRQDASTCFAAIAWNSECFHEHKTHMRNQSFCLAYITSGEKT